jgi:hypothetical protein
LTPLVGRDAELRQLHDSLGGSQRARGGHRATPVAEIAPDLRIQRADEGHRRGVLEARCSALTQMQPYEPIAAMLRAHFRLLPGETPAAVRERLLSKLRCGAGEAGDLERCFSPIMRLLSVSPDGGEDVPGEALKRDIYDAVVKVVSMARRAARR